MLFPKRDRPSLTPIQIDTQYYDYAYCSLIFLDSKHETKNFLNDGWYSLNLRSELPNIPSSKAAVPPGCELIHRI
jgi:hypothetical protein